VSAAVLDGALAVVASSTRMLALAGQPGSFAEAQAGKLAEVTLSSSDFDVAPGETSGRRIGISAKAGVPVVATGMADHVALVDPELNRLIYVTTCPPQAVLAGGSVNFAGWSIEIGDPA
jgi:hypothetical protein